MKVGQELQKVIVTVTVYVCLLRVNMEKLNVEQQAEVKKTSTERLRVLLVKAEEDVAGLERTDRCEVVC